MLTCAGCALLCQAEQADVFNACPKARLYFAPRPHLHPQLAGQNVALSHALQAAAQLLRMARFPLCLTTGADVAGSRAILAVAERLKSPVDLLNSASHWDMIRTWQTQNCQHTTLIELRQRADVVCIIGDDFAAQLPYFYQEFLAYPPSFAKQRTVVFIGNTPTFPCDVHVNCVPNPELFALLLALLKRRISETAAAEHPEYKTLLEIIAIFRSADYGVLAWLPSALGENADLSMLMLYKIIAYLAKTRRFTGLALLSDPENITFTQVSTWRTGFPLRYQFTQTGVISDAWKFDGARILLARESDVVLYMGNSAETVLKPAEDIPYVLIGNLPALVANASVWIPVARTGIEQVGHLFRADQGSVLSLPALRESTLPSLVAVLQGLLSLLF